MMQLRRECPGAWPSVRSSANDSAEMTSEVRTTGAVWTTVLTGLTRKLPYRRDGGNSNKIATGFFLIGDSRGKSAGRFCARGDVVLFRTDAVLVLSLLALAAMPMSIRATSEVIIVGPRVVVAAADSKEVVSAYLVNGETLTDSREICKLRRAGPSVALAAGFVRANDFYALEAIRELGRAGQSLDELAARVIEALPAKLGPALEAARKAGDEALRRTMEEQDALEVAIIGMRDGAPGVSVIAFKANADEAGHITISSRQQRCPGDCPAGTVSYFLGAHEAIEKAIAENPSLTAKPTLTAVAYLNNLEYESRPDIIGGPQTLVRADSEGVRIVQSGACTRDDLTELPPVISKAAQTEIPNAQVAPVMESVALAPLRDELERRLSAASNLVCHERMQRFRAARGRVERDSVEADLRVVYSQEFYSNIRMAGRQYQAFHDVPGSWVMGSLTSMVGATRKLLSSENASVRRRVTGQGEEQIGLGFKADVGDRLWSLALGTVRYPMAFAGTAWFSAKTNELRQIEWKTTQAVQPARLNVTEIIWVVNFSTVMVAGEPFPCAGRFELQRALCRGNAARGYGALYLFRLPEVQWDGTADCRVTGSRVTPE